MQKNPWMIQRLDGSKPGRKSKTSKMGPFRTRSITCFVDTGEELVAPSKLRFRTKDELTTSLADAGFTVEYVYGDWDRRSACPKPRELIVLAAH
jgi:hypothetical protein